MSEAGPVRITSRARCFDCDWVVACDGGETAFEHVYFHLQKCNGPVVTLSINESGRVTFFSIDSPEAPQT